VKRKLERWLAGSERSLSTQNLPPGPGNREVVRVALRTAAPTR
jgi:hypothetical protein